MEITTYDNFGNEDVGIQDKVQVYLTTNARVHRRLMLDHGTDLSLVARLFALHVGRQCAERN